MMILILLSFMLFNVDSEYITSPTNVLAVIGDTVKINCTTTIPPIAWRYLEDEQPLKFIYRYNKQLVTKSKNLGITGFMTDTNGLTNNIVFNSITKKGACVFQCHEDDGFHSGKKAIIIILKYPIVCEYIYSSILCRIVYTGYKSNITFEWSTIDTNNNIDIADSSNIHNTELYIDGGWKLAMSNIGCKNHMLNYYVTIKFYSDHDTSKELWYTWPSDIGATNIKPVKIQNTNSIIYIFMSVMCPLLIIFLILFVYFFCKNKRDINKYYKNEGSTILIEK